MHVAGPQHLPAVLQFFTNVFPELRIARGGPTARRPPPYLNTLDFYARGHQF